jgi:hypothetical protein
VKPRIPVLLLIFVIVAFGCTPVVTINDVVVGDQLSFLQDGKTKKSEIDAVLGEPQSTYENGRIIVFLMCPGRDGQLVMLHRSGGRSICGDGEIYKDEHLGFQRKASLDEVVAIYNLVLVFDINGVVEQHNLIRTR